MSENFSDQPDHSGPPKPPGPLDPLEHLTPSGAESKTFDLDPKALAKLAQATSSAIAWLLIMPDAVALLPNNPDVTSYFLKLLGLWVSAAVLWFVSFWGLLNLLRISLAGVTVSNSGIKLWRFAKVIPWQDITALEIAPQLLFSKFFSLASIANRLTLFESKTSGPKILQGRLITHNIPSFLFSSQDFERMSETISQAKFGFAPASCNVLLFAPNSLRKLKKISKVAGVQRVLITALISVGLVTVLGRKAIVNYSYNYGNRCLTEGNLIDAKKRFETALNFEPSFSAALYNLALTEYKLGDVESARNHWLRAIAYKPDYVEPKISLAHICLQERQFKKAKLFIEKALNISPLNPFATLKRAEYNIQTGRTRAALADARAVTTQNPTLQVLNTALCVIAQAKLRMNDRIGAVKALNQINNQIKTPADKNRLEYFNYELLVKSQIACAAADYAKAEKLARLAVKGEPRDPEINANLIHILILQNQISEAKKLSDQLMTSAAENPFSFIAAIEVARSLKKYETASRLLLTAQNLPTEDAFTLSGLGAEACALRHIDQALLFVHRALDIDPGNREIEHMAEIFSAQKSSGINLDQNLQATLEPQQQLDHAEH